MATEPTIRTILPKRPVCPWCKRRIEFTDPTRRAGGDPYHDRCWRRAFGPSRTDN